VALGIAVIGLLWRVALVFLYYGSEEEDYGNLGLILGTLQSHFTYIETEHMPLFTSLAAAATAITRDAHIGGEVVAVLSGSAAVFFTVLIGWRWLSPAAGVIAGLLIAFQPDVALTAATPLRISTYVALTLAGIYAVGEKRAVLGGLAFAAAFLTRFDAAFTLLPALVLFAGVRRDKQLLAPIGILGATVAAWALYYRWALGTFAFWGAVAGRSTGDKGGGFSTVAELLAWMVMPHVGLAVVLAAPVGLVLVLRSRGPHDGPQRWLALCFAGTFGFFLLSVFLSDYRWDHNLFWKWMCASVPFLALFGAHAVVHFVSGRRALLVAGAAALGLLTGVQYGLETRDQIVRSDLWYGTQVRLMDWVEAAYPEDITLVADLIPATYLSRIPSERRVLRWSTENVPSALDQDEFGAWMAAEHVSLVITFREQWVQSTAKAPWLTSLAPLRAGPLRLVPIAMETEYGWVAWDVQGLEAIPRRRVPPPVDAGLVLMRYRSN
jgi:hypothetical protein